MPRVNYSANLCNSLAGVLAEEKNQVEVPRLWPGNGDDCRLSDDSVHGRVQGPPPCPISWIGEVGAIAFL
jgi:hypothetical protein